MKKATASIPFAGSLLGETRHVCAFFNSDDEEYRVLLPFMKDGFQCGHKAIHVLNPNQRQDHLERLAEAGIDPTAAQQSGQLELRTNVETYLPDGRFDPDRMIAAFEQLASGNATGGFPLSRICCRMDWAVRDRSHMDDVIEFESRVNEVWRHHEDAVICTYPLGQFRGDAVIDILRTHPMVIIGGILQQNLFLFLRPSFCVNFSNAGLVGTVLRRTDMDAGSEGPAQEIKRLQRCINDLVSLLALPAIWLGGEPSQIVQTVLDVLLRMLGLDFAYARLSGASGAIPVETLRIAESSGINIPSHELLHILNSSFSNHPQDSLPWIRNQFGVQDSSIFPVPLGVHGEIGMIVVGSHRADFPGQTESLLLSVAANQASLGLQEARRRSEQKQIAAELDQRVAKRTAELAATNEELRKEIVERKLAEQRLLEEEQELKRSEVHKAAILDSSPDGVVAIDHEGRITEFNPAAEQTFGYRRKDVMGKHLADVIIPPSLRAKHHIGFAHYLSTGDSKVLGRRLEMTALCADGREIPVELTITRIPQDGLPAFTGHLRDITERKQNENALRSAHAQVALSEQRWRSVFENSAVGVALTDLDGRFVATNPVYQKMLGYTDDELRRLSFLDITHEENVEDNRAMIDELLDGKSEQFRIEKQYRRKDGQPVWVRNNVSVVPGTDQVPRLLMALSEDITHWKLSEESLAKARSELANVARITSLGVLAASIAHEVNQPLSGIITNASTCLRMLSADPPNIDGARETIRRTIRDGNRASDVVTRLRTLYSKKEPSPESMDLNEATREVAALSLSELQRSGVMLRHELADNLPPIVGDRVQLQQVILNLLRNGADAMSGIDDRPRELLLRTERDEGNHVRLSVKDSGVGFTPQAAEKIFEAFYTTKTDGMGIGLSISRSIIEAHQGRLWATPNDGSGATFSFAIPYVLAGSADGENVSTGTDPSADAA